jgi:hypothetical protein
MRMKDSWDNEPEKAKRRDALPRQVTLGLCAVLVGIPSLHQLSDVLEQFAHLTSLP